MNNGGRRGVYRSRCYGCHFRGGGGLGLPQGSTYVSNEGAMSTG